MIRQLLTESLLLAALGVILGAITSYWTVTGGSVLLFGLWPALQLSQAHLGQTIVSNSRRSAGSVRDRQTHRALILSQVALTLGWSPARSAMTPHGVVSAAISTNATPPRSGFETPFQILGKPTPTLEPQQAGLQWISPEYFATLRMPLLAGRLWSAVENRNGQSVAIINSTLAERFVPHTSAMGNLSRAPGSVSPRSRCTCGPASRSWSAPPLTLLHAIRPQLKKVDTDPQSTKVTGDHETWIEEELEWQQERLVAWLFSMFSGLALALALVGLGMALGILLSLGLSAFLAQWAKGDTRDPLVLLAGVCLLGGAATLASTLSAWRASSVDPMRVLAANK